MPRNVTYAIKLFPKRTDSSNTGFRVPKRLKTCLEYVTYAIKLFPKRTDSSSTGFNVPKLENTKMHLRTGGKVDC